LLKADITDQKNVLRVMATEARRKAHAADVEGSAGRAVSAHFIARIKVAPHAVVGGYWPIGTELDVRPLLTALHKAGHVCGLPAAQRRKPLVFHHWRPADRLVPGLFDILVPDHHTPMIDPDVLIVPLLAFDASGMRIGYGGGYYDRTIPAIRSRKPLLAVGVAYAAQEVSRVPTDPYDQRLDWIVTETAARRVERRRFPWLRRFWAS
jgi:5-formyltetrahydrofolate cyclo-ligase